MILRNARKHSYSGAWQRGMELNLAVDKWEMGWGAMCLGREGWGEEHTHGIVNYWENHYAITAVIA